MKTGFIKIICLLITFLFADRVFADEPLRRVTVLLDWVTNVQFAGILLAKEQGWYKEAGIDLTIRGWEEGIKGWEDSPPMEEIVSGKAQFGVEDGSMLIEARAKGKPVKAIAAIFQKSPMCLIGKKERKFNSPEQLAGKKVGFSSPKTELMAKVVLKSIANDVTFVQTKGNLKFLINDEVDMFTAFVNNEPLIMKDKGFNLSYIIAEKYGYEFYSGVCFTTDKMVEENPKLVRNFIDITIRGWQEAFKGPAVTAALIVDKFFPEGSVTQQTESLKVFKQLATMGIDENLIGTMDETHWKKGIDVMFEFGRIENKFPAKDVFTSAFLKK